eukprot:scaffold30712_cov55-Phaeocystis_antarctica.AAC.2
MFVCIIRCSPRIIVINSKSYGTIRSPAAAGCARAARVAAGHKVASGGPAPKSIKPYSLMHLPRARSSRVRAPRATAAFVL